MSGKRVVLCADDYALHAGVSQGIVALARQGRLSATSVMTLSPRWPNDAPVLRELRGQLDVGLHLDWTSTFAVQAGHGAGLGAVMWRAMGGGFVPMQVREVIERQLDDFEAHWQAAPDHVDGHQHVQQFPGLREPLLEVLQRRYGSEPQRPWLRISRVAQADVKARIISWMGAGSLQAWSRQQTWPAVAPLLGAYGFDGDRQAYARRMRGWLADAPDAALIMCHPSQAAEADDEIGAARVWEGDYLASADFADDLQAAQVRLVRGTTLNSGASQELSE